MNLISKNYQYFKSCKLTLLMKLNFPQFRKINQIPIFCKFLSLNEQYFSDTDYKKRNLFQQLSVQLQQRSFICFLLNYYKLRYQQKKILMVTSLIQYPFQMANKIRMPSIKQVKQLTCNIEIFTIFSSEQNLQIIYYFSRPQYSIIFKSIVRINLLNAL
ncbi:unnamed protein product [Paramecium sonneborni]|uniref:Uncharacterized protein n=1 Tax=Paramecium sonneborni TaxID=65129 RepID=A0A8S1QUF1_9CILI|nr:unnamed protein product [Paramecium sonneborni]